jgi:hypothetical protein
VTILLNGLLVRGKRLIELGAKMWHYGQGWQACVAQSSPCRGPTELCSEDGEEIPVDGRVYGKVRYKMIVLF